MVIKGTYSWTEKKETVTVVVPLKGVSVSTVDAQVSGSVLKINYAPYLVEIILNGNVDQTKKKASVKNGVLHVVLQKETPGIWGRLEAEGDKETLLALKQESIRSSELLEEDLSVKRTDRRLAEEKHSLRKQMALDESERNRLENIKQEEKETAEREVYEAFNKLQQKQATSGTAASTKPKKSITFDPPARAATTAPASESMKNVDSMLLNDDIDDDIEEYVYVDEEQTKKETAAATSHLGGKSGDIFDISDADTATGGDEDSSGVVVEPYEEEEEEDAEVKYIPPPRSMNRTGADGVIEAGSSVVGINFTPRVFPTPMRESKASEEEDWVAKNRKHLKKHGVLGKNATGDISEEDPVWLKAKGDDFFRSGDSRSAINAYSAAIDADENMTACYSNRSACYLKLNMFYECRDDCNVAIEQLSSGFKDGDEDDGTEESFARQNNSSYASLIKLYMRLATAHCHLGEFPQALNYYEIALKKYTMLLASVDSDATSSVVVDSLLRGVSAQSLGEDVRRLTLLRDADALKLAADLLFSNQQLSEAVEKYSDALALIPFHVSCLSNRSACKMALKDLQGCVDDCSVAIELLQYNSDSESGSGGGGGGAGGAVKGVRFIEHGGSGASIQSMLGTILPPYGSDKRKDWAIKTLLRRGVAYTQLASQPQTAQTQQAVVPSGTVTDAATTTHSPTGDGTATTGAETTDSTSTQVTADNQTSTKAQTEMKTKTVMMVSPLEYLDAAVSDYSQACALDPANEALKTDLNKLKTHREGRRTQATAAQ